MNLLLGRGGVGLGGAGGLGRAQDLRASVQGTRFANPAPLRITRDLLISTDAQVPPPENLIFETAAE